MTSRTAVLVIDLQVGVLTECVDADGVLARTGALVDRARAEGVPVVWVQDHQDFPEGTDGWRIAPPLAPRGDEPLVRKGFRDAFAGTGLAGILDGLGTTRLVVAGAQSDYCVTTTLHAAAARGLDVVLVRDAHTTADAEHDGVRIDARQIVAHTNLVFSGLRSPGGRHGIAAHDAVGLTG